MKKLITLFAASMILLSVGAQANSCPDDPRLDDVRSLIKAVKKGENIEPMQMQYGTFLAMNDKIKAFIGGGEGNPNFKIVDGNCEEPIMIDGEMITKYEMPIEEIIKYISIMQDKGDVDGIDNLIKNVKAKDVSIEELLNWLHLKDYDQITQATTCQLTESGVLNFGKKGGQKEIVRNCRGEGKDWNWPTKIDLYAGFDGQILGKKKQAYIGLAEDCCANGMYIQIITVVNDVQKSHYFNKEYNRAPEGYSHALMSLVANLTRFKTGVNWEFYYPNDTNNASYKDKVMKMMARHNASISGSDELGEDDGSEKE